MSSSTTPDPGDPADATPQHDSYLARVPVIVERIRATTDPFDAVDLLHTVTRATAHLYIESPLRDHKGLRSSLGGLFDTHPPLEDRIARLEQVGGFTLP